MSEGFEPTQDYKDADIIVFNTCSVRENAERRAFVRMREMRAHKQKSVFVLAGCMAQRTQDEFIKSKLINCSIGPYMAPDIGRIVKDYISGKGSSLLTSQLRENFSPRFGAIESVKNIHPWHRYVTITHGCENFCSYCIVPYVRGKLISFPSQSIIEHIKRLIDAGVFEITLLGQNVNQYGQDCGEIPFYSILEKISSIAGLKRLSFLTSHPKDFQIETIRTIANYPVLSRSIHLPLQSGSDAILSKMNRGYTSTQYVETIEQIRSILGEECSLTTDIIVGHPGETEENFKETLSLLKKCRFNDAFTYAYSSRSGTASSLMEDQISSEEKSRRLDETIREQNKHGYENKTKRIGIIEDVLIENISSRIENGFFGKTHLLHPIIVTGNDLKPGTFVKALVTEIKGKTLIANAV